MHDFINNRSLQSKLADTVIVQVLPVDINMEGSRIDLPAFRRGNLFQRIVTMREIAFKGSFAIRVSDRNSNQRSLGERAVRVLDLIMIVETEHKAFSRDRLDLAGYQAFIMLFGHNDFFHFGEIDLCGQELIRHTDRFNHHGRFLIGGLQQHIIPVFIKLIASRRTLFRDVVMSQRKQRTFIFAFSRCGDCCGDLISLEPLGPFLTNNIFHGPDFIHSAFKISLMVIRGINSIAGGILGFHKAGQNHAFLFQNDLALDGCVRYEDFLRVLFHIFAQDSCRKTENQQQQAQKQRSESFFRDIHSIFTSFIVVLGRRKGQQAFLLPHIPIQCSHSPGTLIVTS